MTAADDRILRAGLNVWPLDQQPLRSGIVDGIPWAIADNGIGFICGYAQIPAESHPYSAAEGYEDLDDVVDVHGGLTFGVESGWIGFNTGHYGDYWSEAELRRAGASTEHRLSAFTTVRHREWTVEQVVAEAQRLASQIASAR